MRKIIVLVSMLLPAAVLAQAPAPAQAPKETPAAASAGAGRVAVVDFQKAVIENAEGKKAQEKFMAEVNKRQKEFEGKQKSLSDAQNKLQTQAQVLTDPVKAELNRQIDKPTWAEIRTAYASGIALRKIARNMGISAGTILSRA